MMQPANYQILTNSKKEFNETFLKLRKLGFVYSSSRLKTIAEINTEFGYYNVILIGDDATCRMVLHGRNGIRSKGQVITVDDFIANRFQAYWAA